MLSAAGRAEASSVCLPGYSFVQHFPTKELAVLFVIIKRIKLRFFFVRLEKLYQSEPIPLRQRWAIFLKDRENSEFMAP